MRIMPAEAPRAARSNAGCVDRTPSAVIASASACASARSGAFQFSFAALPPQITMAGVVFGISGTAPIGFVAASDIMRVLSVIIAEPGHEGQEYVCTGPEAIDMPSVVAQLSKVIGRKIDSFQMCWPHWSATRQSIFATLRRCALGSMC